MTLPPTPPPGSKGAAAPAGGVLIALGALVGVAVGFTQGQVTPGFLIGTATGAIAAAALWWRHRAR